MFATREILTPITDVVSGLIVLARKCVPPHGIVVVGGRW